MALYPNRDDLFQNYPELEAEDIRQALAFAAANLEDSATESDAASCAASDMTVYTSRSRDEQVSR